MPSGCLFIEVPGVVNGSVEGAIMGVVEPFPFHVGRGNPGAKMLVERELVSVGGEGFQGGVPASLVLGGRMFDRKIPSAALGERRDHAGAVLSNAGAVACGDVGKGHGRQGKLAVVAGEEVSPGDSLEFDKALHEECVSGALEVGEDLVDVGKGNAMGGDEVPH